MLETHCYSAVIPTLATQSPPGVGGGKIPESRRTPTGRLPAGTVLMPGAGCKLWRDVIEHGLHDQRDPSKDDHILAPKARGLGDLVCNQPGAMGNACHPAPHHCGQIGSSSVQGMRE
jgi:hypothetical protein